MASRAPRVGLFADKEVGRGVLAFLRENHPRDLALVVSVEDNDILKSARLMDCQCALADELSSGSLDACLQQLDVLILAWWPKILPKSLLDKIKAPVVNFHPSLLPWNRGKHYNFWTLVEESPFGVSLHLVDEGIDSGDILFQRTIEKSWCDTGGSLYSRAQTELLSLFAEVYPKIVSGDYQPRKQDLDKGSFHTADELEPASRVDLERAYKARDLLNLLRARTFTGMPSCYFVDNGKRYEVRVEITECINEPD